MTVKELLGHKDIKVTLRYSHLSPAHLKEAVEVLGRGINGGQTGTTTGTEGKPALAEVSKVIENIGGGEGIRTPDFHLAKVALSP